MSELLTELSTVALGKKEHLRSSITTVYGKSVADTMVDEFVPFAIQKAVSLLGIDPVNPEPELIILACKSVAKAFNSVLNKNMTLPGKESQRIEIRIG